MADQLPEANSSVDEYVEKLKAKIPQVEHGALESRVEELLNDASADDNDVIEILHQEFDPET